MPKYVLRNMVKLLDHMIWECAMNEEKGLLIGVKKRNWR